MSGFRIIATSEKFSVDVICKNEKECLSRLKAIKKYQDNHSYIEELKGGLHFCYRTRRYKRPTYKTKTCTNKLKIEIIHI